MTSAINRNNVVPGSSVTEYRDKNGHLVWKQSEVLGGTKYQEVRPASVHSHKDVTGWRPPLAWSHSGTSTAFGTGDARNTGADGSTLVSTGDTFVNLTSVGGVPSIPESMTAAAVNQALNQLLGQGSFNLGEDVGQYQQTVDMCTDKIHSVRRSVTGFKRRYPKFWHELRTKGRNAGRRATNLWLEYEYGWKPLLQDVYGGLQQLDELGNEPGLPRRHVHSQRKEVVQRKVTTNGYQSSWIGGCYIDLTVTDTTGVKVRIDFVVSNSVAHHLASTGLINPVSLVWELLPYSFVVDWFIPVGNYLQAWTAGLGLTYMGGSISSFRERRILLDGVRYSNPRTSGEVSGFSSRSYAMNRAISGWEVPRVPPLKNPLTLVHFANAMSLLVNVFTSDGRIRPLL